MTDEERQLLKAQLTESGFWQADEPGDPTQDLYSLGLLIGRIRDRLAADASLFTRLVQVDSQHTREVCVACGGREWRLATAGTISAAFCRAAILLPEFLRQHPECAQK